MFDKITMVIPLKNQNLELIIKTNQLIRIEKNKELFFEHLNITKNTNGGLFIRIDIEKQIIKIEGSLHKYYTFLETGLLDNHSSNFSLNEMLEAFDLLEQHTNIQLIEAKIKHLEIGLNLYVSKPFASYESIIKAIKTRRKLLEFTENPKFRNKSEIVTNMHKNKARYYKIYDKVEELKDNRKITDLPLNLNILRIETVIKRTGTLLLKELLNPVYLKELINEFVEVWQGLEFEKILIVPKGTRNTAIAIIKDIIKEIFDTDKVLDEYRTDLKKGRLSPKQFRTKSEFIRHKWQAMKKEIALNKHDAEIEFRKLFNTEIRRNGIIK